MRELLLVGVLAVGGCHTDPGKSIETGTASALKASLSLVELLARDLRGMGGPFGPKPRPIQPAVAAFDMFIERDDTPWAAALPTRPEHATGVPEFVDNERAAVHAVENFLANRLDGSP